MNLTTIKSALACVLLAAALAPAGAITVVINGETLAPTGAPPREIAGSVLVPLRGVFEQLGATVTYTASTQTIEAQGGNRDVILILGQTRAYVNGQAQTLAQAPVVIGGTTLVPLRFVAEAFGASVDWVAASQTVNITTAGTSTGALPLAPMDANGMVTGRMTGVYPDVNPPQVTLRVNGDNSTVSYDDNTIVLIQRGDQPAVQAGVKDLQVGDQITVTRSSAAGPATVIKAVYGRVHGTLKSIIRLADGSHVVTLDDGTSIQVMRGAASTMAGNPIAMSDIHPGEILEIRTDPTNQQGYEVEVKTDNGGDHNQPPPPVDHGPVPQITSFTVRESGRMHENDTLHVVLRGTPGAKAEFAIPGIVDGVAMTETADSGVYVGTYTFKPGIVAVDSAVIGRLSSDAGASPLIQAAQTVSIDTQKPTISGENPPADSAAGYARPRIYAVLSDGAGSGVDPQSVKIGVDGVDVTGDAIITASFVTFQPPQPLAEGMHIADVTVRDVAGNEAHKHWSFRISAKTGLVTSLETNMHGANAHLGRQDQLRVTLHAQAGGHATFSVGSAARDIPMTETHPGIYTGSYTPTSASGVQNAPITATFVSANGTAVTYSSEQQVSIDAGVPTPPKIYSPKDGDTIGTVVTVSGRSDPGATVDVEITFVSKALGGLLSYNGKAASVQAKADSHGMWSTDSLTLTSGGGVFGSGKNVVYTVTATTIDETGQRSAPVSITLKRGS